MSTAGLIGLSCDNSFVSKAVRYIRKSQYSHSFVVLGKLHDTDIIGDAGTFGIDLIPLSFRATKNYEIELWQISIPEDKVEVACKKILDLTSTRYGYFQMVGFAIKWVAEKLFDVKMKNPLTDGLVCSEYVYQFLKAAEYSYLEVALGPNDTAPDDIARAIRKDTGCRLVAVKKLGEEGITWLRKDI